MSFPILVPVGLHCHLPFELIHALLQTTTFTVILMQ
jgi:hypothetical protein